MKSRWKSYNPYSISKNRRLLRIIYIFKNKYKEYKMRSKFIPKPDLIFIF